MLYSILTGARTLNIAFLSLKSAAATKVGGTTNKDEVRVIYYMLYRVNLAHLVSWAHFNKRISSAARGRGHIPKPLTLPTSCLVQKNQHGEAGQQVLWQDSQVTIQLQA